MVKSFSYSAFAAACFSSSVLPRATSIFVIVALESEDGDYGKIEYFQ
jgi:hypothetical protein